MKDEHAFPGQIEWLGTDKYRVISQGGLTKRDLFAAMAMQGLLSSFETKTGIRVKAKTALWAADLLILELAKSKELGE